MENNVISKTVYILKMFVDIKSEWGVRDLSKEIGIPVATTHRILQKLEHEGLLKYSDSRKKYSIGTEWYRISNKLISEFDVKNLVNPYLRRLAEKHEETFCFVLYSEYDQAIIYFDQYKGPSALQYMLPFGVPQPIPYGASGKAILAYLTEDEVEVICKKEGFSEKEINIIKNECESIRSKGYCISVGERIIGARGFSTPILNDSNRPIGCILLTTPQQKKIKFTDKYIIEDLLQTSKEISKDIGFK